MRIKTRAPWVRRGLFTLLIGLCAATAWAAAKPRKSLPVNDQMALVFTKGCAADDLACTQSFAERTPRLLLVGRDAPSAPWAVVQHHPATYGRAEGEKQAEGDYRTPEGLYHTLGAVSRTDDQGKWGSGHIELSYPNAEDHGGKAPRPGGGIYIHSGRSVRTQGCVRVLDPPEVLQGSLHRVNMTRLLGAVSAKKGAQLPALLVPYYPERCLGAEGTPLPRDCGEALDWLIAHAGYVSNDQARRVGALLDPIPGAPTPVTAAPPPSVERVPPRVCAADATDLAALPQLPVRIEEGKILMELAPGITGEAKLPPDGQTRPISLPLLGKGQVSFWDCNVDAVSKPPCQTLPEQLESGEIVVLARGEATIFRSWLGHGIFDRGGARAVAPFGVGVLEQDGIVIDTPGGPVEYPATFEVLSGGRPTADCPSGSCSSADLAFDDDDSTAWCGSPGDALVIPHHQVALLAEVSVLNGEYSSETLARLEAGARADAERLWHGSRRAGRLRLEGRETRSVDVADAFGDQVINIGDGGLCMRDLRVVVEATAGDPTTACLSEIDLRFGNPGT